ncbi:hypothetical protein ACHQM5_003558 [Ranunculus cassubicifolius]
MGNCLRQGFKTFPETETAEDTLLGVVPCSRKLKVKITKKQLEELLRRGDVKGKSLEEILAQLVNVSNEVHTQEQKQRLALHSIAEAN